MSPRSTAMAIYTAKYTEEGLTKRSILSMINVRLVMPMCRAKHGEAGSPLPTPYCMTVDSRVARSSGPDSQNLLADVARRPCDVVVVYKDRPGLTRSLSDFAKSWNVRKSEMRVCPTQAFNTPRRWDAALNVLRASPPSRARGSRSERIRDKIQRLCKTGIFMGGKSSAWL